ncbi:hypothetical protein [Pseudofulvibacter geojedonensis]|uniref:UspA domain-containing protein n=1 Tax=Pseudofulvibacter geojedonensis TaxID=1123758 RepID=A0ABW3I1P1_9FLAO
MDNVLVINDYSKTSLAVFDYTISLFKGEKVKVSLFDISNSLNNEAKTFISNKKSLFDRKYELDAEADLLLELGKIIDKKLIDIIILTTKFNSQESDKFIGEKVSKIITSGFGIPILLVPHNYNYSFIEKITFLTDFKKSFNSPELREFIKIALIYKSTIEVLNLAEGNSFSEEQENNKKDLEAYFEDMEINYISSDEKNSNLFSIKKDIDGLDSQMIVFVNHQRVFFNALTENNGIYNRDFYSKVPILILPSIHGNLT